MSIVSAIEGSLLSGALKSTGADSAISRALHVPDAALQSVAQKAHDLAAAAAKAAGQDVATPEMWWRAVETVQAGLVDGSIVAVAEDAIGSAL